MTDAGARDLADQVYDCLDGVVSDNAMSGFTVHRHLGDGTAAVTYRPGIVPAYTAVLRWTLTTWARLLRDAGFIVEVEVCDDRGEKDVPQYLRITGRSAAASVVAASGLQFGDLLDAVCGDPVARESQEFPVSATDPRPCTCRSCKKWRSAGASAATAPNRPDQEEA